MRKVLGSISLLVLILNTLLTPITYAGEYEEILETSGESVTEEVVEETGEEGITPKFSVEEENGEEENDEEDTEEDVEENELETEESDEDDSDDDSEITTGDVSEEGTGEVIEIGSGENTEVMAGENNESVTGSLAEEGTGITEELTGSVIEESIGTGEEVEEIIYNAEPIIGEKTYDNVIVKVEALSGTFPEGTELVIEPIRWLNLKSLKNQLVEEKEELNEDTTIVAFDITFIYSGEEVQPKEGEKVKVIFDYKDNEGLSDAEQDEGKELIVYHLNDKDEEGNKVEDINGVKIEEVEIVNNEEGEVVVDAESFSKYILAAKSVGDTTFTVHFDVNGGAGFDNTFQDQEVVSGGLVNRPTKDPYKVGYMFLGWFDNLSNDYRFKFSTAITGDLTLYAKWAEFYDIVYCDNTNFNNCITLMDRNMGATVTGAGKTVAENSYGFYYQWGNNYGFYYDRNKKPPRNKYNNTKVNAAENGPSPKFWFYGENFIKESEWSTVPNNNLRGGALDNGDDDYNNNELGYLRQGPCPKGYHVPSLGERRNLLILFFSNEDPNGGTVDILRNTWQNKVGVGDGSDYTISQTLRDRLANTFYIPSAGRVQLNGNWNRQGADADARAPFWASSTSSDTSKSLGFEIKFKNGEYKFNLGGWNDERGHGKGIRCFKDNDDFTVTWKNIYDDSLSISGYIIKTDYYVNRDEHPYYDGDIPVKQDEVFVGWYAEGDSSQTLVDLDNVIMNSNKIFVAEFQPVVATDYNVEVEIIPSTGGSVLGTGLYHGGDSIILTGISSEGYQFSGWYDSGDNLISNNNPYIFIADASDGTGLKAVFKPIEYSVLASSNDENKGIVSVTEGPYTNGKRVVFSAYPAVGYTLEKWIMNGDDVITGDNGYFTGDLVIEELTGDVNVTGQFIAKNGIQYIINYKRQNINDDGFGDIYTEIFTGYGETDSTIEIPERTYQGFTLSGNYSDYETTIAGNGSTVVNVYYIRNQYTVNFNSNGGTSITGIPVKYQGIIVKPSNPTKDGYEFSGWFTDDQTFQNAFDFSTPITSNVTLYAKWTLKNYTITYYLNGGTGLVNTGIYTKETETFTLNNPTRLNHFFAGWTGTNLGSSTNSVTITKGSTGDRVYYATYNCEFGEYPNGGCVETRNEDGSINFEKWPYGEKEVDLSVPGSVNKIVILDRNLGAMSSGTVCSLSNFSACGFYYQWGNNYGFTRGNIIIRTGQVDASGYGPGNSYLSGIFIKSFGGYNNRDSSNNANLWGGSSLISGDSVRQGPCPTGYHIPTFNEWTKAVSLFNIWATSSGESYCNGTASHKCFSEKFGLPYAGYREWNGGNKNMLGSYFEYWAANESSSSNGYRIWARNDTDGINLAGEAKTYGFSVRCFKDTERKPLNFDSKGGDTIQTTETVRWWEDTTALPEPTRDYSIFSGWYTTSGYEEGTKVTVNYIDLDKNEITLYAKWDCAEGYHSSIDGESCVAETRIVTYDAESHSGTIGGNGKKQIELDNNSVILLTGNGAETAVSQKPGYSFIGWTDELGGIEPIAGEQMITDNVTYYPIFKKAPVQYRAIFSGNGATLNGNNAEEITVPCEIPAVYNTGVQDTTCPVTTPSIQRAGYEIKGYHESKDHKDECTIIGNQKIQIDGDMTYYAITKKDLTANFNRNGNTAQTKHGETETTTELIEETCSIWNEGTECKVRTPTIITDKEVIGYTTSTTSSGENLTGEDTEITLTTTPVNYYAWTKSTPTEIKISYTYGTGVVTGTDTSGSCIPEVRYNGDETLTGCLIKLPVIEAKTGYAAPKWYRGDTDVVVTTDADNKAMFYYTDGPLTLTAKATVRDKISYVVKHYFQTLENNTGTNKYQLNGSETDEGLSGEVETVLVLSGLKKQIEGFEYFKATVNGQPVENVIDIDQAIDYAETHQLTTPVEIKLLYTRNRYQYTLNEVANVTTEGSTESVNAFYGQEITLSGGVSNDCYERSGWQGLPNGVANTQQTSFTMSANPVTITPVINEKTYTIVFDANAEDAQGIVEPKNVSCTAEVQLDGNNVYTRNGYLFQNWNTKSDGSGTPYAKDATITTALTKTGGATVTLYAQWNASGYIVTFDANSGVVSTPSKEVTYNQPYGTLPTPTREGYEFTGWYTQPTGGEKVTADTQVTVASNHTLYAQWEVKSYTVTFDANSGEVTPLSKEVTYDGTYGELPIPNRTGYTFQGWYTQPTDGDQITASTKVTTASNHILFAHWEENHYTIAFDANSGDGDMAPIENIPYSESTTLSENAFTRNGYHFIGWGETDSSTTVAYEDKATVKELTGVDNATVILYALRSKGSYKIDYILNGGALTGGRTNLTGYSVDTASFTLNNPERDGYDFIGWSGTDLTTLTTGVTIAQGSTGDRVYEANWQAKEYTISYNLSGGALTGGQTNPGSYTIETANFTLKNPERTGYTFKGWSGTDLTTLTTEVIIAQGSTGNREYVANWEVKTYTITWRNSTGTTLRTETLPYGSTPNYEGTPTSGEDAQYTYTFTGWDPAIKTVTEDQVYTAVYDKTVRSYTITWLNDKGQQIDTTTVEYGKTPTHADVPKAVDQQYTYTFKGWDPEIKPVTGEAIYTATYSGTLRNYTITWNSSTGVELRRDTLPYGDIPNYGENPTSGSTAEYEYTFAGWDPELTGVTADATYTATYNSIKRSYTITWKKDNGDTRGTTQVEYGKIPTFASGAKASTEQTGYNFIGWYPEIEGVTGDATYTEVYAEYLREYTILWKDYDGEVIKTGENVSYGTLIVNNKPTTDPSREATAQTGYTFTGWYDGDGIKLTNTKKLTGDISYIARYEEELRTYTIIWNNRNGTELEKDENVPYGTIPSYDSAEPTSGADIQYTYYFSGWTPLTGEVTGDQVYTATYISTVNEYQIRFLDENGTTVLQTKQVPYGTVPSYEGSTPTKEGHTFKSWNPTPVAVNGATDYTATYTVNNYNVTPVKGVGVANILGGGSYPYNTVVTLTGIAKEGYHFEGGVSEKAFTYTVPSHNITPQIDAEPNTYHVHFKPNGGTGVMANQEFTYDVEQELSPNAYTRSGFTFISWTDGEGGYYTDKKKVKNLATTGSVILLAQWFEGDGPTPGPTPTPTPSGGGSGGGGRRPVDKDTQEHASAEIETGDIKEIEETQTQTGATTQTGTTTQTETTEKKSTIQWTEEELTAYQYAYKYGITTLAPKEAARPNAYVIRGHMAKMVVNYALNVLNRKLPAKMPKQCKWKDGRNAWESQEIKEYAEKACALGLMGIDMDYFQPNKLVTRAQFGTIFGRLLWGKLVSKPYYAEHLARLKKRGIMTQIDRPEERIEVRKWAWLMFMRSEKYFKIKK